MRVVHELKTWPQYFDAIQRGEKTFDVRKDDRGFQKGDILRLLRTCPKAPHMVDYDMGAKPKYVIERVISYILAGGQFGIEPGHVVIGFMPVEPNRDP